MTLDPGIGIALIGAVITAGGWLVNRKKLKAEVATANEAVERAKAETVRLRTDTDSVVLTAVSKVTAAMQDTYQEMLADVQAQVVAAKLEATSAMTSAREAKVAAQEAENNAWLAEMRARAMERFLMELRPLIAAHIPDAEAILERLDRLTSRP